MNQNNSYRQIFKATSIFGGVQIFTIIVSIIRSKLIAILLGPIGMGISVLFTSTITLVGALTNFGLSISAVKDISEANESLDEDRIAHASSLFLRLVKLTAILGVLIAIVSAPLLSEITFGNDRYTAAFRWLSISLLFTQLTSGQIVILQGMRKLALLAKANMLGSLCGLVISIPLYYFYKLDGIVPGLILNSLCTLLIAWYFTSKINIRIKKITNTEAIIGGRNMLKMGLMLSVSTIVSLGVAYIVRIYIGKIGGVNELGLYSAGFSIINTYVGLVFTAMGTDYYPRLSGVASVDVKLISLVNQQAEIAILILSPILIIFFVFIKEIIVLLYSVEFISINGMILWAALGMYFKAVSWAIGFIMLAKGDSKTFLFSELISNACILTLNILGYRYFGLDGLGISFLVSYILVLIQVFTFSRFKYQFRFHREFYKIFFTHLILAIICYFVVRYLEGSLMYLTGLMIISFTIIISLKEIDKRIGLKNLLSNLKKKAK